MMKKKSQMYQQQQRDMSARLSNNPISKSSEKRKINTDLNLKNIMSSRSTRVVNFKKDVEDKGSDNENFIPTPESSITHSEQSQASQNANGN